jgi:hypothetical protein
VWLDEKIVVSSQRRMGWRKKGILLLETFTYGSLLFLYCWMRRTVFSSQRTMGPRKKHSFENLSICVIVVGLGNIAGCKLLDEN